MPFNTLGLTPSLLEVLAEQGFNNPFPIQEKAIPAILQKKDVLGIAQTGWGKTATYVLPMLMNMAGKTETNNRQIGALVLVPTRELAIQVEEEFRLFGKALPFPFKSLAVYGGASINPQMKAMRNVDVLVATPGRLLELFESNAVQFFAMNTLVLDEADKMLNLGFKKEMDRIFELLPKTRQNLLFSATLSPDVQQMETLLLKDPVIVKIDAETDAISLINQSAYFVKPERKGPLLRYLIQKNEWKQVLVFTSSVYQADLVADKLFKKGVEAHSIHSKKTQGRRQQALSDFKSGKLRVLVATDLLSRGIDIEFLPHVINYELPRSPKDFIHRIGRTGRAENPGDAITFVTEDDMHHFNVIQKKMKLKIKMEDSDELNLHNI